MYSLVVSNVNQALPAVQSMMNDQCEECDWRDISPRGIKTVEYRWPFSTVYLCPTERVLFSPVRDANPFFHLFESIWILAGRRDVKTLAHFNSKISQFSDDGIVFHAAYGHRIRRGVTLDCPDQLLGTIELLKRDPDTRRAVMSIWDPRVDSMGGSKDIPCNDMIFFKIRDGVLNMTVLNRSNDIILGAYGANVVQFSMLQEFIAHAVGVGVGVYTQVSDSFHYYPDEPATKRVIESSYEDLRITDYYLSGSVKPYPLMASGERSDLWLVDAQEILTRILDFGWDPRGGEYHTDWFRNVASPMLDAWTLYKYDAFGPKKERAEAAISVLNTHCKASDWRVAGEEWLMRRALKGESK